MLRILMSAFVLTTFSTIYGFQLSSIDGGSINFSHFEGKKILIVNTASNSQYVDQLESLNQLYHKYKDSLVVVAVPSNSFGNEPGGDDSIRRLIRDDYNTSYLIAGKTEVIGPDQAPLYKWLTTFLENKSVGSEVSGDYYKYLVGSDGKLIGYFVSSVDPMDSLIQKSIEKNAY